MQASYNGKEIKPTGNFDDLVEIMYILRRECPWDRKQTHESIKDLMVEEIYEAIEAIDNQDMEDLKKELGDILLHVVFHSEMADQSGRFSIKDVIREIQDKLIRRHPHVFAQAEAGDSAAVKKTWESLKMQEKERKSVLQGVPQTLPGLIRAQRMQEKAGAVGFDWKKWKEAWKKLVEELQEFKTAADEQSPDELKDEFGDVLFSVVNVGRLLGLDAEDSLRMTNNKFQHRFKYIEDKLSQQGLSPKDVTLEQMDRLWEEAKSVDENRTPE